MNKSYFRILIAQVPTDKCFDVPINIEMTNMIRFFFKIFEEALKKYQIRDKEQQKKKTHRDH